MVKTSTWRCHLVSQNCEHEINPQHNNVMLIPLGSFFYYGLYGCDNTLFVLAFLF